MATRGKVFITGGVGFIGSLLAEKFIRRGYEVVAYDALRSFVPPTARGDCHRFREFRLERIREAVAGHEFAFSGDKPSVAESLS